MLLSPSLSSPWSLARGHRLAVLAVAVTLCADARAVDLTDPPARLMAAGQSEVQKLVNEGKLPQALKALDDLLVKSPKDTQLRFQRGVVLSMLNRRAEALTAFQKLVEEKPDMAAAHNNMAVIYGAEGNYEAAKVSLEKAVKSNPNYATAYQNLGDVHVQLASQAYQKAQQLDKTDTSVQPKLALLRDVLNGSATATAASPAPAPATAGAKAVAAAPAPATVPAPAPAAKPVAPSPTPAVAAAPAAPTPPAATAAAKPASAAPVAKAAEPAKAADATAELTQLVRNWASAWSSRDVPAYIAFYTPDFAGKSGSRKSWEKDRAEKVGGRSTIKVEVSDVVISVIGDKADVRFRQSYESESVKSVDRKRLSLVKGSGGQWLIRREVVEG